MKYKAKAFDNSSDIDSVKQKSVALGRESGIQAIEK